MIRLIAVLTLNAPIATKVLFFSRLLKCLRSLYGKQCGPRSDCSYRIGAVCSWSTLFASILNSSLMLGNYLQQTTSADYIFRCIFFISCIFFLFQVTLTPVHIRFHHFITRCHGNQYQHQDLPQRDRTKNNEDQSLNMYGTLRNIDDLSLYKILVIN